MVDRHSTTGTENSAFASASSASRAAAEPTMLETQLDSIALTLTKMKAKLSTAPSWDQLSTRERAELAVALSRVENRVHEVGRLIRRDADMAVPVHAGEVGVPQFSGH